MQALLFNIQKFCLHDGDGIRTTVFFKGCPLACRWCANPESQQLAYQPELGELGGRYYSLEEVVKEVLSDKPFYDKSGGGATLSGGEPLLQPEFVKALITALHQNGVSVGMETAAHVKTSVFSEIFDMLDFADIDLKHYDAQKHKQGAGCDNALILDNIRYALKTPEKVTLRIPIIPGFNSEPDDALAFGALIRSLGARHAHILPFHQLGQKKYAELGLDYAYNSTPMLHPEDLEPYAAALEQFGGFDVQIGG